MQPFKVEKTEAEAFAKVWNYKGLAVPLNEVHTAFATDFANICIRSFVQDMVKQAAARKLQAEEQAKPILVEA